MSTITSPDFLKKFIFLIYDFNVLARKTADRFTQQYNWNDNDARIYFFNAVGQHCLLHGYTATHIQENILNNKDNWKQNQTYFGSLNNDDFIKLVDTYSGLVRNNFFLDVVIEIEHAVRIFASQMIPSIVEDSISVVKDKLIKQLNLDKEYLNLFGILFQIRNTIHNGGLHSATKTSLSFKGKTFDFVEKEASQSSLENIEFLFKEVIVFLTELFELQVSKDISNMEHPYKRLFDKT